MIGVGQRSGLIALALFVAGCSSAPVKDAVIQEAIEVPLGSEAIPLAFSKIVVDLPRGAVIGELQGGWLCVDQGDLKWRSGRLNVTTDEFTEIFHEELTRENYPIVGDPEALFADASAADAELLVAGRIEEMQANFCYPNAGFGNFTDVKGKVFLGVNWQVYSTLNREIVLSVDTEGSGVTENATDMGDLDAFADAFSVATRNLLANDDFHSLVTKPRDFGQPIDFAEKIRIEAIPPIGGAVADHMSDLRAGVLTVRSGLGHGSAFVIDGSGYALTNQHVVRGSKFVKVISVTGREMLAGVVRFDSARDVALLRLEEGGFPALSIASEEPAIGSDVYAIGSPRRESLDSSVTKGVVSGYREERGLKLIQSDVATNPGNSGGPLLDGHGNVVGITVSGLLPGGSGTGVNFFIPIHDALRYLEIEI